MKYINTKTGAIIDIDSELNGGDWELFIEAPDFITDSEAETEGNAETVAPEQATVEEPAVLDEVSYDEVTKKEIMRELDAWNIEYDPKMTKRELYNLMTGG